MQYWYAYLDKPRQVNANDAMQGSYLGPQYSDEEIESYLQLINVPYEKFNLNHPLEMRTFFRHVAGLLSQQKVVGWFQGRMEFGPRALGHRSILADPRGVETQTQVNLKIKFRESFRPFAPSVLETRAKEYFDINAPSPYMLFVAPVAEDKRESVDRLDEKLEGIDRLKVKRSSLPAITHVDYSARVQTVNELRNGRYFHLLKAFETETGCPVLLNTSFNVRGEPIVCSPTDAYRCFMRTDMDYLVLGNCILDKREQPSWYEQQDWRDEFELD